MTVTEFNIIAYSFPKEFIGKKIVATEIIETVHAKEPIFVRFKTVEELGGSYNDNNKFFGGR